MIKVQTRVKHMQSGLTGTTCPDLMSCCSPGEVPVIWDGKDAFEGTDETLLEVLGPENAVPAVKRCGMGRGAECCIFLVTGAGGFKCARFSDVRWSIIFKKAGMRAQREPVVAYPGCMFPEGA